LHDFFYLKNRNDITVKAYSGLNLTIFEKSKMKKAA